MSRIATLAAAAFTAALVAAPATRSLVVHAGPAVDTGKEDVGAPPVDFEFLRTGGGEPGQWTVVPDTTAVEGTAIEHVSVDPREDRYPLAIYAPLSPRDARISVRFKIIKGSMQTAGLVARFVDADNYYLVSPNALEERVDLFRVQNGRMERIWGTDADVGRYHWQTLDLIVEHDQFTVALDKKWLFTASDRAFLGAGRIGLRTEEDNVTRFDQLEIKPLPSSEER